MKTLKTILASVYVVIIILLLLSPLKCQHEEPVLSSDTIEKPIQVRDSVPEEVVVIKETFSADVVMCIDCTSSMNSIISTIKNNALTFYPDLKRKCKEQGKDIKSVRFKVIAFRDFTDLTPFEESPFFRLPDNEDDFNSFVSLLHLEDGGDSPERGYDALAKAINSSWRTGEDIHQIIILWTDNASHPLSGMNGVPTTMAELTALWDAKMNRTGKRLILFAPSLESWNILERSWEKTTLHDVSTGGGLSDVDYEEILRTLSETM